MIQIENSCLSCETCYHCGAGEHPVVRCNGCGDILEGKCFKNINRHYCPDCFYQIIEEPIRNMTREAEMAAEDFGFEVVTTEEEIDDASEYSVYHEPEKYEKGRTRKWEKQMGRMD